MLSSATDKKSVDVDCYCGIKSGGYTIYVTVNLRNQSFRMPASYVIEFNIPT